MCFSLIYRSTEVTQKRKDRDRQMGGRKCDGGGGKVDEVDPGPGLLRECKARVSDRVQGVGRNQCVHGRLVTPLLQGYVQCTTLMYIINYVFCSH